MRLWKKTQRHTNWVWIQNGFITSRGGERKSKLQSIGKIFNDKMYTKWAKTWIKNEKPNKTVSAIERLIDHNKPSQVGTCSRQQWCPCRNRFEPASWRRPPRCAASSFPMRRPSPYRPTRQSRQSPKIIHFLDSYLNAKGQCQRKLYFVFLPKNLVNSRP